MPVGLSDQMPELFPIAGIRLSSVRSGIKKRPGNDLVLIELSEGCRTAAVFTKNDFCAAPVTLAKAHLQSHQPKLLMINSGNANAGTGQPGMQAASASCAIAARLVGCAPEEVLPFSTGVIGELLPVAPFETGVPLAMAELSVNGWAAAARGIMTTDIVPKAVSRKLDIDGHAVTITGIAKGSGMIHPNMATMLGYVATDAAVSLPLLQKMLSDATDDSFNSITVDGDTSTNDACTLTATGRSSLPEITDVHSAAYAQISEAVTQVLTELATMIVRDGEGATKFISIVVEEAATKAEAKQVGFTVAHSPLVKTAFFASDPNWGRILAAVGRAGLANLNLEAIRLYLGDVCIVENGGRSPTYTEEQGAAVMKEAEITIRVKLARGSEKATIYTCDFSYDYVKINAEYRS
ncbi:MAG: bifunctional glutamate N-acetyltransferase/amino-acid acetyltransferase ArgJ [Gammaproteobacteria bacterium]|nr:bifunctional glutamate N-acetyltransferase/amino-acid acetyltransferase ArgJ [Gammaproteobacteria bacterium]